VVRKRSVLLLGLVVLAAAPAFGATDAAELARIRRRVRKSGRFYTVAYKNYVIKTDIDAQFAAEAAVYMNRFYVAFRSFFRPKPKVRTVPTVYFFKNRETYKAYVKRFNSDKLLNAGGFYRGRPGRSELFCWHNRPGTGFVGFPRRVIRHEGAHQLLSYILGSHRIPVWYNEGVATFFEGWNVEKPRDWNLANLEKTNTRFAVIRRTFGTEDFLDLHHLVRLNSKTWVPDGFGKKTLLHYAEVQSFMTFLLVSKNGRKFFTVIFKAIAQGTDPSRMLSRKVLESAQRAWYKDIEERIERSKKGVRKTKVEAR